MGVEKKTVKVTIVQRRMTHYRVEFFERLREVLRERGVKLDVVYGQPHSSELSKNDGGNLPWAQEVRNRYIKVLGKTICWMPFMGGFRCSDLVIVTQENSIVSNFPLLAVRRVQGKKSAFWGHGMNFQGRAGRFGQLVKEWSNSLVDWWFAYTEVSEEVVVKSGFPPDRISCVNNAVNTDSLRNAILAVNDEHVRKAEKFCGKETEEQTLGIFVGSLHEDKEILFLLEAADLQHEVDSEFRLVICGDGEFRPIVESFAKRRDWAQYVGAVGLEEKAKLLRVSDLFLNPGMVGLGILDAFAAGIPIITSNCGRHSPEISYLNDGGNGIVTGYTVRSFAEGIDWLSQDSATRIALGENAAASSFAYSLDKMVARFSSGISLALRAP